MKTRFVLFCLLLFSKLLLAQEPFIMWVHVYGDERNFKLYTDDAYTYNYSIDLGNGVILNNVTETRQYYYPTPGTYAVKIYGDFPHLNFSAPGINRIAKVIQWGDISWRSMDNAFAWNTDMVIEATDAPDLSQVSSLYQMFYQCHDFNSSINHWDVSNVTNMKRMFHGAESFNQPLDNWDVSNVINMEGMFLEASAFNGSLDNWNVSNIETMDNMFFQAASFNQPLNHWDISNVTSLRSLFRGAFAFNQPLNNWDISNVTNIESMFYGAIAFNQPLDNWDVSNVTSMRYLFKDAFAFNHPLNNWDVSGVTSMQQTFNKALAFNQPLIGWDVSNVTNMQGMFENTNSFNQSLNDWNVSNVTTMDEMFKNATSFNGSLNDWDVSNVVGMDNIFNHATSFNQPLNNWDVSNKYVMRYMFSEATSFNQPLDNWDVSNVYNFNFMFQGATSFNQSLENWDFSGNWLGSSFYMSFLDYTNMDVVNYDNLIRNLIDSGHTNKSLGALGLEYCNIENRAYLVNDLGWNIIGDNLSPSCSNLISGTVSYDFNGEGCVASELVNNILIEATFDDYEFSTEVNAIGDYSFYVYGDTVDVTMSNIPEYFIVTPESQSITFGGFDNEVIVDFCLTAPTTVNDLKITLLPLSGARPGFEADYKMVIENIGTETMDDVLATLSFNNAMQSFTSSLPMPTNTGVNTLDFELGTLLPFEIQEIAFSMQTFQPPIVNGDDVLNFTVSVVPDANDYTPNDNTFNLEQIVVNSFDPNDKRVLQGSTIDIDETGEYLDYIIRFQNTGTASAINVRVEDELHPNLDWSTLRIVSVSHDYNMQIIDQNQVKFIFDDINLPFEADNEPASHGYIAYKIKPRADIQIGEFMSGHAAIFFDFNAPIITNTVSTVVVDKLSVTEFNLDHLISIFPNPANDELFIKVNESITIESVKLYNLQGIKLLELRENFNYIETTNLPSGIYLLGIETNKGSNTKKLIIK